MSRWFALSLALLFTLAACGGGSSNNNVAAPPPTGNTPSGCSLNERKTWAVNTIREWYLYPETLPATLNINQYATVDDVIDAMTATARAQNKDRFFTYLTSIAEENAFFSSGSSAGFGIRLQIDTSARRLFISESFETAPAFAAGIDRRDEILAIGTTTSNLRLVSDIIASEGAEGVTQALGPSNAGVQRVLRVSGPSGLREVSVTKADYSLAPVSPRYGALVLERNGKRVGYFNLRTFISAANTPIRDKFLEFRNAGINEFILDFRYNGGGLVSVAELLGDMLGGNRRESEVFSRLVFNASKTNENSTRQFRPQPQSVSPIKMAFITTRSSASASELMVNSFVPYFGADVAIIGANSFGKPVGQVGIDRTACDDRLRVVAFTNKNSAGNDNYFNGLIEAVQASCRAADDLTRPLGSAEEESTRQALDYLEGRACVPIPRPLAASATASVREPGAMTAGETLEVLLPARPSIAQRNLPGLF